jgi:hypothetical protein
MDNNATVEMVLLITSLGGIAVVVQQSMEVFNKLMGFVMDKKWDSVVKLLTAITLCTVMLMELGYDITMIFGSKYTTLGVILTGVILSQGAKYLNDTLDKLKGTKEKAQSFTKEYLAEELGKLPIEEMDDVIVEASILNGVEFANDELMGQGELEDFSNGSAFTGEEVE